MKICKFGNFDLLIVILLLCFSGFELNDDNKIDSEVDQQLVQESDPDVFNLGPNRAQFAVESYTDLKKVFDLLEESEKMYGKSKKKINLYDIHLLETNAIIKTLEQCYKVIKTKNTDWEHKDT